MAARKKSTKSTKMPMNNLAMPMTVNVKRGKSNTYIKKKRGR